MAVTDALPLLAGTSSKLGTAPPNQKPPTMRSGSALSAPLCLVFSHQQHYEGTNRNT